MEFQGRECTEICTGKTRKTARKYYEKKEREETE